MAFSDAFLDELRARLPVSAVVGRKRKLIRSGAELVVEDDRSITVNDKKGLWFDFGKGDDGGDIFQWLIKEEGMEFRDAVETCASIAGIALPKNGDARPRSSGGPSEDPPWGEDPPPLQPDERAAPTRRAQRELKKAYDYTDRQGTLLYQVCRMEWVEDGKIKKTFMQRRPSPEGDDSWIWGLAAGDFLRGRNGDWYQATEDRLEKWTGAERRNFPVAVHHGLYRLVEFTETADPSEPVWLTEGEKDADTLVEWGLVATTNSGGAGNWRPEHAEAFRGLDVVLAIDNDEAGRKRADKIGQTLRGVAKRVRVLDFAQHWPGAPKGADVTDWKRQREGDREELLTIAARCPLWTPPPFHSQFGGIPFEQLDDPGPEHEYVIDGWMTVGDKSVIGGPSKSGKSFLAIHTAGCIATGMDFFGNKVMTPGLVIYQAGEGSRGVRKRFRAWRQHHGIRPGERVPIYILQSKIDIWRPDGDTAKLIEEIKGICAQYDVPLRGVFIDTLAQATGGADENSGKDMSTVMANIDRIAQACPGAHVSLVHHMNAGGTKLRGHTSVYANVDQVVLVTKAEDSRIRTAVLDKQKDGEDGFEIKFELFQVEVGRRAIDNKAITSCVTLPVGGVVAARAEGKGPNTLRLSNERAVILQSLKDALSEHGEPPPLSLKLPKSIKTVVRKKFWRDMYLSKNPDAVDVADNTINKRMRDAMAQFQTLRIVGVVNPWVWVTGRLVQGVVELPTPSSLPEGGIQDDMLDDVPERGPEDMPPPQGGDGLSD